MKTNIPRQARALVGVGIACALLGSAHGAIGGRADVVVSPGPAGLHHYEVTIRNVGTTVIGTLWFAWIPNADFLRSKPVNVSFPPGWHMFVTGYEGMGYGIKWVAWTSQGAHVQPGTSLAGFSFDSPDGPELLRADAFNLPGFRTTTSFIYSGTPFSDGGYSFVAPVRSACVGDLNIDTLVDDADFSRFVAAYDVLNCGDWTMPDACAADLNSDGMVDDADFSIFVAGYDALICGA